MLLPLRSGAAFPAHPRVAASALEVRTPRLVLVDRHTALDVWTRLSIQLDVQLRQHLGARIILLDDLHHLLERIILQIFDVVDPEYTAPFLRMVILLAIEAEVEVAEAAGA